MMMIKMVLDFEFKVKNTIQFRNVPWFTSTYIIITHQSLARPTTSKGYVYTSLRTKVSDLAAAWESEWTRGFARIGRYMEFLIVTQGTLSLFM